jgi:uncharacterized protein YfaA (DUF2138 family)
MSEQLALNTRPRIAGYYRCSAWAANRMSGSSGIAWYPDEQAAHDAIVARYQRSHRHYLAPGEPQRVFVELVRASEDRGEWGSLPADERMAMLERDACNAS